MARARLIGPGAVVAAGLVAVIVALELGGGAVPLSVGDPGAVVRWGTPIARMLQDIATATLIGGLVLACFALVPGSKAWDRAIDAAAAAAGAATAASAAVAFLAFRTVYTDALSVSEQFTSGFLYFFTQLERGQYLGSATLAFAVVTTLLVVVRSAAGIAWITVASTAPLILLAAAGHAGTSANHALATSALWLHLVFVSIWVGGLIHLAILRLDRSPALPDVLRRYSTLALASFVVVAFSGIAGGWVRTGWEGLATPYGGLLIAKTVLLVILGGFGAWQRTRLIPRAIDSGRIRWFLVAELAFMGAAMGVSNGLAQTPTPVAETLVDSSPATVLTGEPLPPPFDASRLFTIWSLDPLWTVVCALLAFFYVAGVVRLRRRGDTWPVLRTISWLTGVGVLWWVTSGALTVYGQVQFSLHMGGHMLLGMAVPLLLVPGAPITLGMRAIAKRTDGTRGGREWLLAIVQSRAMHVLGHPIVATGIFVSSLWIFYFSPLFRFAMENHLGHALMVVHFVGAGYLFVQALIGTDPSPHRTPFPMRLVMLLAAMAAHAFFGVTIMTGQGLLLADWFGAMGNGVDALEDQQVGGGIAWSIGEFPTLILALVTCVLWARTDTREQRRVDRKADRDGDADLQDYNAMLERMSKR